MKCLIFRFIHQQQQKTKTSACGENRHEDCCSGKGWELGVGGRRGYGGRRDDGDASHFAVD